MTPNLILFYVADPVASAAFYERLLETPPEAVFPTYAAFAFESGLSLGLWSESAKDFVSGGSGHRSELAFMVPDDAEVERLHEVWRAMGVEIEQAPIDAVFGRTFVARDPDGHRIRVCTPDD
ncbi:VOC family protein [Salipiger mangrovisoli]|uniref:VOC family protein n=1 Tax=Salipiger mangrovisoli TaxID=2865933 RepID=A0ABR9X2J3_9RHOB|nr:VOC family protein [Salipiger mangrovisoli]MBE9637746.1 VOC family protein [Salipiger mangrovisoli]